MSNRDKPERTLEHINRLDRSISDIAFHLISIGRVNGLPAIITSSTRSIEEQEALVMLGSSLRRDSRHLFGRAFDIDMQGYAPDDVPIPVWQWMGEVGEALGLKWGGRWRFLRDYRHFEV